MSEMKDAEAEVARWREACELEVEAGKNEIEEREKLVTIVILAKYNFIVNHLLGLSYMHYMLSCFCGSACSRKFVYKSLVLDNIHSQSHSLVYFITVL